MIQWVAVPLEDIAVDLRRKIELGFTKRVRRALDRHISFALWSRVPRDLGNCAGALLRRRNR